MHPRWKPHRFSHLVWNDTLALLRICFIRSEAVIPVLVQGEEKQVPSLEGGCIFFLSYYKEEKWALALLYIGKDFYLKKNLLTFIHFFLNFFSAFLFIFGTERDRA